MWIRKWIEIMEIKAVMTVASRNLGKKCVRNGSEHRWKTSRNDSITTTSPYHKDPLVRKTSKSQKGSKTRLIPKNDDGNYELRNSKKKISHKWIICKCPYWRYQT